MSTYAGSRKYRNHHGTFSPLLTSTTEVKTDWRSLYANALAGLVTLAVLAGTVIAVAAQFVK